MDWTAFLPGRKTLLLFPSRLEAVRSGRFFGRTSVSLVGSWEHDGGESLVRALGEAKNALGMGADDICHVGLPLAEMTLVDFQLPAAARADLPNAVRYALMRHVPFSLENMAWSHEVRETDGGDLGVSVTLMTRASLDGFLEHFSRAGVPVASVFPVSLLLTDGLPRGGVVALNHAGAREVMAWSGERISWQEARVDDMPVALARASAMLESYGIEGRLIGVLGEAVDAPEGLDPHLLDMADLDFEARRRFRIGLEAEGSVAALRRARRVFAGAAAFLLCTLLVLPLQDLMVEKRRLSVLEERVESLRADAQELADIRQRNVVLEERLETWGRRLAANPDMLSLLRELTRIVPKDAWLDSLQVQDNRVIVAGKAPSATSVLEKIENSVLFEEGRFDAPITKVGSLEAFRIAATVSRQ